jgi:hypothetical protein
MFSNEVTVENGMVRRKTKDSKTKDGHLSCRPCSSYKRGAETCRTGCDAESVDVNGLCPFNFDGASMFQDLQASCKCYK